MEPPPEVKGSPGGEFIAGALHAIVLFLFVNAALISLLVMQMATLDTLPHIRIPWEVAKVIATINMGALVFAGWVQLLYLVPRALFVAKTHRQRGKGILLISALLFLATTWCNGVALQGPW